MQLNLDERAKRAQKEALEKAAEYTTLRFRAEEEAATIRRQAAEDAIMLKRQADGEAESLRRAAESDLDATRVEREEESLRVRARIIEEEAEAEENLHMAEAEELTQQAMLEAKVRREQARNEADAILRQAQTEASLLAKQTQIELQSLKKLQLDEEAAVAKSEEHVLRSYQRSAELKRVEAESQQRVHRAMSEREAAITMSERLRDESKIESDRLKEEAQAKADAIRKSAEDEAVAVAFASRIQAARTQERRQEIELERVQRLAAEEESLRFREVRQQEAATRKQRMVKKREAARRAALTAAAQRLAAAEEEIMAKQTALRHVLPAGQIAQEMEIIRRRANQEAEDICREITAYLDQSDPFDYPWEDPSNPPSDDPWTPTKETLDPGAQKRHTYSFDTAFRDSSLSKMSPSFDTLAMNRDGVIDRQEGGHHKALGSLSVTPREEIDRPSRIWIDDRANEAGTEVQSDTNLQACEPGTKLPAVSPVPSSQGPSMREAPTRRQVVGIGGRRVRDSFIAPSSDDSDSLVEQSRRNIPLIRGRGGLLRKSLLEAIRVVKSSGRIPKCLAIYWIVALDEASGPLPSPESLTPEEWGMLHVVGKVYHACQAFKVEIERAKALGGGESSHSALRAVEHDLLEFRHSREALLRWLVEKLVGEEEVRRFDRRETARRGEAATGTGGTGGAAFEEGKSRVRVDSILGAMEESAKDLARGEVEMLSTLELRIAHTEAKALDNRREMGVAEVEEEVARIEPQYRGEVQKWLTVLQEEKRVSSKKLAEMQHCMRQRGMAVAGEAEATAAGIELSKSESLLKLQSRRLDQISSYASRERLLCPSTKTHGKEPQGKEDPISVEKQLLDRNELHRTIMGMGPMMLRRTEDAMSTCLRAVRLLSDKSQP